MKSKDGHQEYLGPHQIQSPQARLIESPTNNVGRQMQGSPYYHHQQQPSPLPHVQPVGKTTSPAPPLASSSRTYTQTYSSPSSSSSPQCPPLSTNKTSPSPGAMNPPYAWPNHMSSNRIPSQSPVASPHHHYRITQSPIGSVNAPSPQSPIFRQPSPKPSPSPTHLKQSPQTTPLHTNYKSPYGSNQNLNYIPNDPSKVENRMMSTNYPVKAEKMFEKSQNEHMISPYYRSQEQKSNEYTTSQNSSSFSQKYISAKYPGYPDYAYPPKVGEQTTKSAQKFTHGIESHYTTPAGKYQEYPPPQITSRLHEKPNYREMINHVYAIRNATSEEDLNYEIIKRTLNKDISVRRSDSDLSKNIFDCPVPTKINNSASSSTLPSRSVENFHYMKSSYETPKKMDNSVISNKYSNANTPYEVSKKSSFPDLKMVGLPESGERSERRPSLPMCSDLTKNDISVTVSKVVKPVGTERPKLKEKESTMQYPQQNPQSNVSEYSNVVVSRVNANHLSESDIINRPKDLTIQQQPQQQSLPVNTPSVSELKISPSVPNPAKRESPLDLSVKTVKTKADSTGCDEHSTNYYGRSATAAQSLKVDFSPNFSKHTTAIVPDVNRQSTAQSQAVVGSAGSVVYDVRHANINNQPLPKTKQPVIPQQPSQHQYHATASNSNLSGTQKSSQIPYYPHHQSGETYSQYPSYHQLTNTPNISKQTSEPSYQQQIDFNSSRNHENVSTKVSSQVYSQSKMSSSSSLYTSGYDYENYKYHHYHKLKQQQQQHDQQQQQQPAALHQQPVPPRLSSPSKVAQKREFEQQSPHLTNMQKMEYQKPPEMSTSHSNYSLYRPNESRKDGHQTNNAYVSPTPQPTKREATDSNSRQNIILNPPMPTTVYDKKSDDYLVNTPQKQKKVLEKPKESNYEASKLKEKPNLPPMTKDRYAPVIIQKYENPYVKSSYESSQIYKPHINDSRHLNEIQHRQQQQDFYYGYNACYNQQQQPSQQIFRDKAQEEYFRKMENKTHTKYHSDPKKSEIQSHYDNYISDPVKIQDQKLPAHMNIPSSSHMSESRHKTDLVNDKISTSEYGNRKRHNESTRDHQLPEKQVRVDELYRAHLEKTYKQQQQTQQHHHQQQLPHSPYTQNTSPYQRPEITPPKPSMVGGNRKDPVSSDFTKNRYPPYKEEYIQPPSNNSTNQVPVVTQHQQQQQPSTWYSSPALPTKENVPHSYDGVSMERDSYPYPPPSGSYPHPAYHQASNETCNKINEVNNRQIIVASTLDVSQKSIPTISSQNSTNTVNTNISHRGADQNVLSKLRTSIEMREYEKQKSSIPSKISPSGEQCEEENKQADIASLLAARIRTKGELKGYTPIPLTTQDKIIEDNSKPLVSEAPSTPFETFSDGEGHSIDLMDWGSACNDFVEQLQTGTKKRNKRRKSQKTVSDNTDLESEKAYGKSLPGVEYNGDIDKSLIEQIKTEKIKAEARAARINQEKKAGDQTSSDEDKPLFLLRQQSVTDTTAAGHSDGDKKSLKSQKSCKSQESDVTRSSLAEKLSERVGRNLREKQRIEQEKRIAARLGSSTSDSEDELRRAFQRPKKLTRKPRSRASGASTRELSETDSSGAEDKSMSRNLVRSRRESRKRKLGEKTSTESDSNAKRININAWMEDSDDKTKSPATFDNESVKREFVTKARVKCMKLPSETSESSDDNDDRSQSEMNLNQNKKSKNDNDKTQIEVKNQKIKHEPRSDNDHEDDDEDVENDGEDSKKVDETESTNSKNLSDDESKSTLTSTPIKNDLKKVVPPLRLSRDNFRIDETMTRSKSKKELEQKIANSKILRNEKVVENTTFDRKNRFQEKTSTKAASKQQDLKPISNEKNKNSITKGGKKSIEELKRKRSNDDPDDKSKKKIGRFQNQVAESTSSSSESSEEEETKVESVSDRLRSRKLGLCGGSEQSNIFQTTDFQKPSKKQQKISKEKSKEETVKKLPSTPPTTPVKKSSKSKSSAEPLSNTEKFPPGWEMEVYQYKRAMKVPPNLITIKGPAHHRVSTSLPDLDPHSSDASESFGADNSKSSFRRLDEDNTTENYQLPSTSCNSKKVKSKNESKVESSEETEQPRSIIDVLHSRLKTKKSKKNARVFSNNEPRILPRGTNEAELLPTPVVRENKPPFGSEHRNLFETEILKTRTRTESRVQKTKELIREVFGGEDRPASAPPELRNTEKDIKIENMSFDEKYEEYLQKMNVDFGEKIRKNKKGNFAIVNGNNGGKVTNQTPIIDVSQIKQEKLDDASSPPSAINHDDEETRDTEINACMQNSLSTLNIKEETQDTNERYTPSVISERDDMNTPCSFANKKKGHKSRNGRRKGGSSGFDYIRKKKKPSNNNNAGGDSVKKKRTSPVDLQPTRTENDVSKEIKNWVLNKSVGQSALHKAARLGYLDVIAYCLERLKMHPDPKDNAGYTPLHEACSKGRLEIARVLLQYGANHSETAHSGIRPLHEASENGYTEIVRLLLSYGADPLVTTYSGKTIFL